MRLRVLSCAPTALTLSEILDEELLQTHQLVEAKGQLHDT